MRPSRIPLLLAAAAAVLAVTGIWLAVDNPDIDGTSRGDDYTCAAPYDTVLNDADNVPGGEPPADSASIAARCRAAGAQRFDLALAAAAGALAGAGAAAVLTTRRDAGRPSAA